MNWKRILLGVGALLVIGAGAYFVYTQFIAPEPATEAQDATAETTAAAGENSPPPVSLGVVSAEGTIVPLRDALLSFQTGGEVTEIIAEKGSVLSAGDAIMRLDTTDQEIALVQAQAALAIAEASKQTAEAGLLAAQVGQDAAAVGLQAAEVALVLAQAEPTEAEIVLSESAVALAEAGVSQASAGQSVVLQGPTASQIQTAEAQLRAAEAELLPVRDALDALRRANSNDEDAVAQAEFNYNAALAKVNAAQAAVDEARAGATSGQRQSAFGNVSAAAAQRDAARSQLDLLLAGPRAEQITVAEAGVAQAESAIAEAALAAEKAQAAVTQADAGVAQATAAVKAAEDDLDRRTLKAPFDGVVADIQVENGEIAGSGVPVATFGDFGAWLVKTTDLTELDVVDLQAGAPVEIQIDAIPGEVLSGTVSKIASTSQVTRGDVTYEVTITLDDTRDLPLRWGMTVFVDVDVE
ncbi:MAG: HlyD family efflux transporter periplasmic adaptor subunit [Candidatus Promineifilaceae bacterium]|nr:HlyD family efflux transporter periplasmic adaptor subunit [Candidatus Promineifilaceae bacterium]